jgi:RNA polymerase sigma-70 factor, ECF subfamily
MEPPRDEATKLLDSASGGDCSALEKLIPIVYGELHRLAAHYLQRERPGHTLQPTALVHEAFLRLIDRPEMSWQNRAHFIGVAAQAMRRILVDYARERRAAKRDGGRVKVTLDESLGASNERTFDVLAIDEALSRLTRKYPRHGQIVELRFFGGFTVEEIAEALGIAPATVKRQWILARAWLKRELGEGEAL